MQSSRNSTDPFTGTLWVILFPSIKPRTSCLSDHFATHQDNLLSKFQVLSKQGSRLRICSLCRILCNTLNYSRDHNFCPIDTRVSKIGAWKKEGYEMIRFRVCKLHLSSEWSRQDFIGSKNCVWLLWALVKLWSTDVLACNSNAFQMVHVYFVYFK